MFISGIIKKGLNKFDLLQRKWTKSHYIFFTVVFLILTYIVFIVQAENNDDPEMMQYISGYLTGKPDILPYIMGMPYTYIISRLYLLSTGVPWYGLVYLLINTGAVLVICDKFMKNNCTIENYFCFLCLYVSLFLYQLTNIQFTMVAGLSGAAAIMIVYDACKEEKINASGIVLLVMFSFFSYNIRYQCGLIALGVMVYVVLGNGILLKEWNKTQIIYLFFCFVVMAVSALSNTIYVNNTEWKEYVDLNSERSLYMDVMTIEYEDNKDIYASVGWDEDIFFLRMNWCFMDESANREVFAILNLENEKQLALKWSAGHMIREFLSNIINFERILRWQSVILVGWLLWIIADFIHVIYSKEARTTRKFIYALGFCGIASMLIVYLILFGRYNSRTVIMILTCCLLPGYCSFSVRLNETRKGKRIINIIMVCGLVVLAVGGLNKQKGRTIYSYDGWDSVYDYVLEHKDCIYVGDTAMSLPNDLFRTFSVEERPTNYTFWGGWLADSPLRANFLETNGLQELKLEDMLDDNKFFVGKDFSKEDVLDHLLSYYNNRFGNVKAEIYYETDDFIVYGFRRCDY